jgi:signal transduction histidine kinase
VETPGGGSTRATMTRVLPRRTVPGVRERFFKEPPAPLRAFGLLAMTVVFLISITTQPEPGLHGDGPWVILGLVLYFAGITLSVPARDLTPGRRITGLLIVGAAAVLLTTVQPRGAMVGAVYYVVIVAAIAFELRTAVIVSGVVIAAECVALAVAAEDPADAIAATMISIIPWFLVMRLVGQLHDEREELKESRAAHAESAALAERGRVARDMHDVLAHSLSALALQLEGARLLARDRDADPEVVAAVERAHHLAADGLAEARDAIAALRGEMLPGPERLEHLADAFDGDCTLTVTGTPHELGSEARLAIYRTAQEALTNVLRHSAFERVDLRLAYERAGTRLAIEDRGAGAPVTVGGASPGGGYGLTGMRERAELLGGSLTAEPTADGFRVELWLPA